MAEGVWRSGKRLVMRVDATLPDRCVKTNRPAYGQWVRVRLRWHHPALYLVLLANLIIYLIVSAFVGKTATVKLGMCNKAIATRRLAIIATWTLALGGIGLVILGAVYGHPLYPVIAGIALMLLSALLYVRGVTIVRPVEIEGGYVWLAGVHPDYLASLPEWDGGS